MEFQFEVLRVTRKNVLNSIKNLTIDQLNTIPEGFNNNIMWNVVHLIATQQLLVYGLSGQAFKVSKDLINAYRKGTAPSETVTEEQFDEYKKLFFSTIDQMEEDYNNGLFGDNFKTYPTSFGITLEKLEDAITFNNAHEAMHLGNILSMKKLV